MIKILLGLFIFILIITIITEIYQPVIKGHIGESRVSGILAALPLGEYCVINDVMLKTERGTTQIDHVVVSKFGIFVIETKNYTGWITGSEYSEKWTKNVYGNKYYFYNPIRQNYGHIKALSNLLGLPENHFIPIVVFSDSAELRVNSNKPVINISELERMILSVRTLRIQKADLPGIVEQITNANISSRENRIKHIANIHKSIDHQEEIIEQGICPRCGGRLVQRNGKYGIFTGCSNYPKCRYTIN